MTITPRSAISRGIDRPRHAFTAWVRLITRPAPWQVLPKVSVIRPLRPRQDVGPRPHVPGDEDRLPRLPVGLRQGRVSRREGPGRPLPVDAEADLLSLHGEGLDLGDVVADVVEEPHPQLPGTHPQRLLEDLPRPVHEDLAVGPGVVGRAGHRREIVPPPGGRQPGAGELAVGQGNPDLVDVFDHPGQVIVADLIAQAPGAAVDQDADLARRQAEGRGGRRVEDLLDDLDLEEVVSRPERPELVLPPLQRPVAHRLRIGARHHPAVLRRLQVGRRAVALPDRPGRPLGEDLPLFLCGEPKRPPGADAGGDVLEEGRDELLQPVPDILMPKTGGRSAGSRS